MMQWQSLPGGIMVLDGSLGVWMVHKQRHDDDNRGTDPLTGDYNTPAASWLLTLNDGGGDGFEVITESQRRRECIGTAEYMEAEA
jgi:hypothetical protein